MREFAADRGLDPASIELEFDIFHNDAIGDEHKRLHVDWPAAWRTWILREVKNRARYAAGRNAKPQGHRLPTPEENAARAREVDERTRRAWAEREAQRRG